MVSFRWPVSNLISAFCISNWFISFFISSMTLRFSFNSSSDNLCLSSLPARSFSLATISFEIASFFCQRPAMVDSIPDFSLRYPSIFWSIFERLSSLSVVSVVALSIRSPSSLSRTDKDSLFSLRVASSNFLVVIPLCASSQRSLPSFWLSISPCISCSPSACSARSL